MVYSEKIQKALKLASVLHHSQKRKGDGCPYISHPYAVALILGQHTSDEDVIIAGLLHDVLEDVPTKVYSSQDMQRDFGMKVFSIVKEVTEDKDPEDGKEKQKETWKLRKERYMENLKNDSMEALMVACADKIHNLMSLTETYSEFGESIWAEFNSSADERLWFYKEALEIIRERLDHPIVAEYEASYLNAASIIK